ncbi:MAG TPA: thioesterase [Elusimicrobiales bacterium]|nr:thioesterase [Elusimicrobiales bacterium]
MTSAESCRLYSGEMTVRCYEQDLNGRLRPAELFNWFQEAASCQCRINRVGLEDIIPKGYTWVIHRYKVSVAKMPVYGQRCKVSTWAQPKRDLISVRDFLLESQEGEQLAGATSEWALIDLKTGRPTRLSSVLSEFPYLEKRALDENLRPIQWPEAASPLKSTETTVSAWALDKNLHVNNSVYIFWAFDNLYPEAIQGLALREIEINYKKQAFYGQKVVCRSCLGSEGVFYQEILLAETGEILALLKSTWVKID